jgi:hypothetical protein
MLVEKAQAKRHKKLAISQRSANQSDQFTQQKNMTKVTRTQEVRNTKTYSGDN